MPNKIIIRAMEEKDIEQLHKWFGQSSVYKKKVGHFAKYITESKAGKRVSVVAVIGGKTVGFSNLKFKSTYDFYHEHNIPEINDMIVAPPYRKQGIARKLIEYLEHIARQNKYNEIGIGVGLYADYGPAQRLYIKLGYVPDGNGITYHEEPVTPGKKYKVDDELLLWFVKTL